MGYPKLDFKPIQLRTWFLVLTLGFFLSCIIAIISVILWARAEQGFIHIHRSQAMLAFRYVPVVLASISTIWFRAVFAAYGRMHPYIVMSSTYASKSKAERKDGVIKQIRPSPDQIFVPSGWHFSQLILTGRWLLCVCGLTLFTAVELLIPLKAILVQITPGNGGWTIAISPKMGYTIISIYGMLSLSTLAILIKFYKRATGLKWDPVSIADQLALVQGSTFGRLFIGLETAGDPSYPQTLKKRGQLLGSPRLGYWRRQSDARIWHGIALTKATMRTSPDSRLFMLVFCT